MSVMHEKAKFVCFIHMQPQKAKFKFVQINMKHVSYNKKKTEMETEYGNGRVQLIRVGNSIRLDWDKWKSQAPTGQTALIRRSTR